MKSIPTETSSPKLSSTHYSLWFSFLTHTAYTYTHTSRPAAFTASLLLILFSKYRPSWPSPSLSIRCIVDSWGSIDFFQRWHLLCPPLSHCLDSSFTLELNRMSNSQAVSWPITAPPMWIWLDWDYSYNSSDQKPLTRMYCSYTPRSKQYSSWHSFVPQAVTSLSIHCTTLNLR